MTAYNLPTNYASATYNFVPNGAKVTHVHDIIETASCNACHDQLSAHGGSRRGMNMCVLCHTAAEHRSRTPATRWTPRSSSTRSIWAQVCRAWWPATPYIPAINSFGTFNYSTVVFPADPGDPRRCEVCHSQTTGAAQATAFLTNPTRAACGSCHDNVNFATGANHPGGIQTDDNAMRQLPYSAGRNGLRCVDSGRARGADRIDVCSSGLAVNITKVTNGTAGSAPVVSFTVLNNSRQPRFRFRRWARSRSPWRDRPPISATPASAAT